MFAAYLFNEKEGLILPNIYGMVTTGNTWKFLKYELNTVYIDVPEYHVTNINKIISILVSMVNQEA